MCACLCVYRGRKILAVADRVGLELVFFFMFTHIWFSVNISAMCSFNQSNSFLAEKENSSTSECVICRAEDLSSAIHGAEPTGRRAPLDPFITTLSVSLSFFTLYTAPLE